MARPFTHAYIACSLDGYIARADGSLDWLTGLPTPAGEDYGYAGFMAGIDAILMGRVTYDTVRGFPDWPYTLPVRVLTRNPDRLAPPPAGAEVRPVAGPLAAVLAGLAAEGFARVYADGGQTLSALLRAGLLDRLTVTRVPVLLGAGLPLFSDTGPERRLAVLATRVWPNGFVQTDLAPA